MKKQIGLIALTALIVSFMAFSSVASAQASNVQVLFFTSPLCGVCAQVKPLAEAAAAENGLSITYVDVSTAEGSGMAKANSITTTPTIIISGQAPLVGSVSQAQISAAMKAAIGSTTPTVIPKVTPTKTPTATPTATVKQTVATPTTTVKKAASVTKVTKVTTPSKTVVKATKTEVTPVKQPTIEVVTPAETPATSTQTVPEFSLLGLGAPALAVGAIYLFLRRR
jgi:glutaredoxin